MISNHFSKLSILLVFFCILSINVFSQVTLVDEDFDDCEIPNNWTVDIEGNQDVIWYIDDFNHNLNSDSSSINSTCMIAIDDDATGNNTPPFVIRFSSPEFNGKSMRRLFIELDINYRVHIGNFMRVIINDGENDHILKEYHPDSGTGPQFSDFEHLEIEATAYASEQNTFIIEYEDTGSFGWYGAFDNVFVWSEGEGVTMYSETFDDCIMPAGWTTNIVNGVDDWQFGIAPNGQTMNGSCFAYFDDDALGDSAAFSLVELITPPFDGTVYKELYMDYEIILRSVDEDEGINIVVESDGIRYNLTSFYDGYGGPEFFEIENETLDLSLFKSQNMRIIFQYEDGNQWGWWVGVDNIFIYGIGVPTDICGYARDVFLDEDCLIDSNTHSANDGVSNICTGIDDGSLWYKYEALVSGKVQISTNAKYNDVITLFTGDCDSLLGIDCSNRDEYGFTGENIYFEAIQSQVYYIRTAGLNGEFGVSRGDLCIQLSSIDEFPVIADNDLCSNATVVEQNSECITAHNWYSTTGNFVPEKNNRARADVWFSYLSGGSAGIMDIATQSDFSETITLYKGGNCNSLVEVTSNEKGKILVTPTLEINTQYYIQVTSFFATTEGELCLSITPHIEDVNNDVCIDALEIALDASCTESTNVGSTFSGVKPSCVQNAQSDVWFSFITPSGNSVKFLPDFNFISAVGIYSGGCDSLIEIACFLNPQKCDGYIFIESLEANTKYFIQVLPTSDHFGIEGEGDVCLEILDGNSNVSYSPLVLVSSFECTNLGIGELTYAVNGGTPPYTVLGAANGDILHTGDDFIVVVSDQIGCEASFSGVVNCGGEPCNLNAEIFGDTINCLTTEVDVWVDVQSGVEPYTYLWSTGDTSAQISVPPYETNVSVMVKDYQNCEMNLTPLFVFDTISPTIQLDELVHAQGGEDGSISVTLDGGEILTYEWYLGFTYFSSSEDISNLEPGEYSIVVTNAETGCVSGSQFVVELIVSNQNVGLKNAVKVVSNLTQEVVIIHYDFTTLTNVNVELFDIAGRKILSINQDDVLVKSQSLDVRNLAPGSYKLLIYSKKEYWLEDVVIYK